MVAAPKVLIANPVTGDIAITQDSVHYMVAASGTATTQAKPASQPPVSYINPDSDLSIAGVTGDFYLPLLVCRSSVAVAPEPFADHAASSSALNAWSWLLWAAAPAGATIDWWVFDLAKNGAIYHDVPARFELWLDGGDLVFSSRMAPLRPVLVQTGIEVNGSDGNNETTYSYGASGRTYACGLLEHNVGNSRETNIAWTELIGASWSGNSMTTRRVRTRGSTSIGADFVTFGSGGRAMIVDVTDL